METEKTPQTEEVNQENNEVTTKPNSNQPSSSKEEPYDMDKEIEENGGEPTA